MNELKVANKQKETSEFSLEPMNFSELSDILGGAVKKGQADNGHAGGFICWC